MPAPVLAAPATPAQDAARSELAPAPAPLDEYGRGTPRGTVRAFLDATARHDFARAAADLDLRRLPAKDAAAQGADLARQLRVVLDHTLIDLEAVSDKPEGWPEPGMPSGREIVGRVEGDLGPVSIALDRVPRDDGVLIWKFSAATIARVPELYQKFTYGTVGRWLPAVFVETRFLRLALWQWIGLVGLALVSFLVAWVVIRPAMPIARWVFRRLSLNPSFLEVTAPARLLVALAVFRAGQTALWLPVALLAALAVVQKFLLVIAVAWLIFRLVETTGAIAQNALVLRHETASLPLIGFAQRTIKLAVAALATLVLLEAMGVQVSALIAAIGVGGIGLALAAQRTVENLFGGLAVMGDQPVRVGDYCRFGDRQGTVERIGLWSTRIRTLQRSVVSVPNAQFVSLQIENITRRDRILFEATLPLRYETTPDQLRYVLVRLRELLYAHPRVDPVPARVRFAGFGTSSLNVEVFAYVVTTDFEEFMAVREDLSLRMMELIAAAGTAFALPGQRNYDAAAGLDDARSQAAAAEVERWRREGQLPLPEFPPERVKTLGGTLDYPPEGSSQRAAHPPRT